MRTKVTLVLIFLNVALFFFIFKFERTWRTEAASLEARKRVLGPEAADIRFLEVTSTAPGGSFALARQRDTWTLTKPLEWPANPHAVSTILNELRQLQHETSFSTKDLAKSGQTLADYGLDKPKLTIAFASGDPAAASGPLAPTILRIGDTTKAARLYILSPNGDRIHVVSRALGDLLALPLEQLRADALMTIPVFEARLLSVQTATPDQARGGATAGVRVRVRRDGTRWSFESPIIARASRTALESAISQLNGLRAKTFNPPAPAVLPSIAPTLRIGLEGNGRHETLFLGEPVLVTAPGGAASKEIEYFAQLENRAPLFTVMVPTNLVEALRAASEKLRERHLLDFEPAVVSAIQLVAPGANSPPINLQRLEAGAASEGAIWQIVRRGTGNQGLETTPADRTAVDQFLQRLTQLSAQSFVSDNPSNAELEAWGFNRPEREITLTLAAVAPVAPAPRSAPNPTSAAAPTATPAPAETAQILRLGTDATGKVYARTGTAADPGSSIYAVDVDLRATFSVDPLVWRDRALPAVPANARITALTITDLSANQVVFETAIDANGQPANPAREAKDVLAAIGHLRAPRAKAFFAGAFSERVFVGGDERAWKYRIDASVGLPGREQVERRSLWLTERTGGSQQLAGSREFDAIFEVEQPFLDVLWRLLYGPSDPGPPPAPRPSEPATSQVPRSN